MSEHTKEPWEASGFQIRRRGTRWPLCHLPIDDFDYKANARRIVDCVNALAGLNPSGVAALIEAAEAVANVEFLADENLFADDDLGMISVGTVRKARTALANIRGEG